MSKSYIDLLKYSNHVLGFIMILLKSITAVFIFMIDIFRRAPCNNVIFNYFNIQYFLKEKRKSDQMSYLYQDNFSEENYINVSIK